MHGKHFKAPLTRYKKKHPCTYTHVYKNLPQSVEVWLQKVFPCPPPEESLKQDELR